MGELVSFPRKFGQDGQPHDPWLTKPQVAMLLKRSERWVEMMHHKGIPHRPGKGGRTEYPYDGVLRWWDERQSA